MNTNWILYSITGLTGLFLVALFVRRFHDIADWDESRAYQRKRRKEARRG